MQQRVTQISLIAFLAAGLGGAVAQPEELPAIEAEELDPGELLDGAVPDGEPSMGWTLTPIMPNLDEEPVSELDRLSRSPSGVSFGGEVYDSRADNPLVPVAVTLRALDKITATFQDIEISIGEEAQFGPLRLVPQTCDKRPPEEIPETTVFLEVFSNDADAMGRRAQAVREQDDAIYAAAMEAQRTPEPMPEVVEGEEPGDLIEHLADGALFRGWMFASSPSLNALEHPVYDVWVIDCKMEDPRI